MKQQVLQQTVDNALACLRRSWELIDRGRPEEAVDYLARAIELLKKEQTPCK